MAEAGKQADSDGQPAPPPWQNDRLLTVVLPDHHCRILVAEVSGTAFEAEFRHLAGRVGAEVMARAAAAAVLLGADLKDDERLSIQARCEGPIKGYLVEVDSKLGFRGYTQKKTMRALDRTRRSFAEGLSRTGRLQVIRSTSSGIFYQGVTAFAGGDVSSDLERSLLESQQIPSRLLIDHGYESQLTHARGILLQALPGVDSAGFDQLAGEVAARAESARPWTADLDALVSAVLPPSVPRKVLHSRPVAFACRCSRERAINVLKLMGPPEGETSYPEESRVTCAFCNDTYVVTAKELV
jgi:molecular chaperone Hsp33